MGNKNRKNNKKPKIKAKVNTDKKPKSAPKEPWQVVSWVFKRYDNTLNLQHKKSKASETLAEAIFSKLKSFEGLRFADLQERAHIISVNKILKDAQKKMVEMKLDDYDSLISFRLGAKERLWCIRLEDNQIGVLWWDPEHKIYPVLQRNT